jgi:hypothetical protein
MRERARLDAEELLSGPPFQVFGLAEPRLQPMALAGAGRVNGAWANITLAYGDWAAPAGPFAAVTSAAAPDHGGLSAEEALADAIVAERNRLAGHAGMDEEEPPGKPACRREQLRVGDAGISALVCRHGSVWAARAQAGTVTLTVVAREIDAGSVRLSRVSDLEPYLRGRSVMLGRLAERHRERPPPALEPAEGVAAFRALAEAVLARHGENLAAVRAGRERRLRAGEGAVMHALWQRAVAEQTRVSGAGEHQADQVVTLVVNHLTHLQDEAAWFTAQPRLREAAINETLRHNVLGDDVPSQPAQQAWAAYWTHRTTHAPRDPGDALRALQAERAIGQPLSSAWLQAWSDWAQAR